MRTGKHATTSNEVSPVLSWSQTPLLSCGGDWVKNYQVQNTSLATLVSTDPSTERISLLERGCIGPFITAWVS